MRVLSLTERTAEQCKTLADKLKACGLLATVDNRNEKIGYKIREAQVDKVPYMLIIGDKEAAENVVSVRHRNDDLGKMTLDELVNKLKAEIADKTLPM